jgi:chitinase
MLRSALRRALFLVVCLLVSSATVWAQPTGAGWTPVAPPAGGSYQISVGGAANVWVVNTSGGSIYRWTGAAWTPMPSPATPLSSISVARDGTVWGLQPGGGLVSYQSNGTWALVAGPSGATLTQISVANYQSAWAVDSNGHVWNRSGSGWSDVTGTWSSTIWRFTQVSAGSDGTVMAILTNVNAPSVQMTAYFVPGIVGPGSWSVLAPQLRGSPVAVGDLRNVWFLNGGAIYRMPDTIQAWNNAGPSSAIAPQGGTLAQIAASSDAVWGIDPTGAFWRYTGSGGCGTNPLADFALDAQMVGAMGPPALYAGQSSTLTIGVERTGGFDDFLTFSTSGVPAGVTLTYAMNPVGAGSAQLTMNVSPRTQPGSYSFTLTATSSSGVTRTTTIQFTVPRRVVGYYANWKYYSAYYVENIETSGSAGRLSHVNYAFANVVPDPNNGLWKCQVTDPWADYEVTVPAANVVPGTNSATLRGNWNELLKLKARHPQIKTLISIGGWTLSDSFYAAASTVPGRQALVSSCLDLFIKGNVPAVTINGTSYPGLPLGAAAGVFDGVDIDWEYPGTCGNNASCGASAADAANYVLLMQEFRNQMTALTAVTQKEYLLTAAVPASYHVYEPPKMDIAGLSVPVDFMNLMGYDFHGSWENRTNLHPPLYNPSGNPDDIKFNDSFVVGEYLTYLAAAVPPQPATKLVLGVPFYGYDWTGVGLGPLGTGLYYQPTTSGGTAVYNAIKAIVTSPGWTTYQLAGTTYSYNPTTQVFWTYDSPTSLATKGSYVRVNGLGGGMFWELSGDTTTGELITSLYNSLQ